MVRTNPIPPELVDRPFIEQVRALPARVALEAFLAAAAGFTDDPPARDAFAVVLRRLTAEIFSGDLPRDVRPEEVFARAADGLHRSGGAPVGA